jgi:signal transduction histidine kinase
MSKEIRRTLSKRLSRSIMVLAIPLFVLALGVFYRHANVLLHKEAMERSTTILNTTMQLVENYLSTIKTAANANVAMMEDHFDPDSLQVISRRIVHLNRSVLSCSISTEPDVFPQVGKYFSVYSVNDGDSILTVLEPEFEYFEKNWYKKPMEAGRPCWINPFSDFNEGVINHHDAVGSYCIPLRPQGRRIVGVVSVDFSFQKLRETVLATHHPYPSSYYMLLGPAGGYLRHPETSLLFKTTIFLANDSVEHPDIHALGHEMTAGHHGTTHVTFNGELCHVCYAPVSDTGWSLALVCHEDDVLEDYNHLTIVMIVIVVIGMLLIFWITKRVVRRNIGPLDELMDATEKIADGDYDTLIPETRHKDVVGKLQNAFRQMQQAIVQHAENVRQATLEVERESEELEHALPLAKEVSGRRNMFIDRMMRQMKAPIDVINGLTKVLRSNLAARGKGSKDKGEVTSRIADTMLQNANHLLRMTQMLFDSSDTGIADTARYDRKDDVCCNDMGRECIAHTLASYAVGDIRFETKLTDTFSIRSSRLYVQRTIRELLHNAVKFSDGQHISLHIARTDSTVCFIVEDKGPGLPENSEQMIFVPFAKVDDLTDGLGLGLPLCKRHAVSLGGDIVYDESYQDGCRFIFELPIQD